jgi:hypothetical protein
VSIVASPEAAGILRRHGCYIHSMPSIMAVSIAIVDEAEERLGAAACTSPDKTLSSLRAQPDLCVSSAGHTTRLKFALRKVSVLLKYVSEMHTLEMLCL